MDFSELTVMLQNFLWIISACFVLLIGVLLYSNRFTRKKLEEMKQTEEGRDFYREFQDPMR